MPTRLAALALIATLAACERGGEPPTTPTTVATTAPDRGPPTRGDCDRFRFTDVTAASGVDLLPTFGVDPPTQILEVKGGGVALIDADDDGDLDLFVPNGATLDAPESGPGARLWENLGAGRFRDVTADSGLDFHGWGMGVATGDVDGDGREDLFISAWGRDRLYLGRGAMRFEDATEAAGLGNPGWGTGCAFGDVDGDGDLDLYVARYLLFDAANPPPPARFRGRSVLAGPRGLPALADSFYENLGGGRFRDATADAGFAAAAPAYGLGATMIDVEGDGDLDVYVGNDSQPSYLFINDGTGRFEERGGPMGIATSAEGSPQATMGIAVADVNGDGLPDLFTTNFASDTNTLHVSLEGRFFADETRARGLGMVSFPYLGWSAHFADLDQDGVEELFVVNGHVYPDATMETMNSAYLQPPLLFTRSGDRFRRIEDPRCGPWLTEPRCDRSAVLGDLDGDGDLDAVVVGRGAPVRVLRNDGAAGASILVELRGAAGRGARVTLAGGKGERHRWIASGSGFLSAGPAIAHFGVAEESGPFTVRVRWADGTETTRDAIAPGTRCRIER